jgi:hypothetical protein
MRLTEPFEHGLPRPDVAAMPVKPAYFEKRLGLFQSFLKKI